MTLSQARLKFQDDVTDSSILTARINSACELLINLSGPKGVVDRVVMAAYFENLTLSRRYETCLGMLFQQYPIPIRNGWVEFVTGGAGQQLADTFSLQGGVIDLGDGYCCFTEPLSINDAGCRLKFVTDAPVGIEKTSVKIEIYGTDVNGKQIRTTATARFGEEVSLLGAIGDVTTTASFCTITKIVKAVSKGLISVYAINPDDSSETLISTMDPAETLPNYRRYKVPTDPQGETSYQLIGLCRKRHVDAVEDNDVLSIDNEGAIRNALEHLQGMKTNDKDRAMNSLLLARQKMSQDSFKNRPPAQFPPMINWQNDGASNLRAFL